MMTEHIIFSQNNGIIQVKMPQSLMDVVSTADTLKDLLLNPRVQEMDAHRAIVVPVMFNG